MQYKVEIIHSNEGFAIGCPELPGCWTQGQTEEEAIANIKSAISDYLSVVKETSQEEAYEKKILFVEVPQAALSKEPLPSREIKPFKVVPFDISIPHFTKVEDLLDILEGPDRR